MFIREVSHASINDVEPSLRQRSAAWVRTVSDAAHAGRRVPLRRGVETTEATDSP
jgi:hypothetical protein